MEKNSSNIINGNILGDETREMMNLEPQKNSAIDYVIV